MGMRFVLHTATRRRPTVLARVSWAAGMPLWIKTPKLLRAVAERVAKQQFAATKDPTACALPSVAAPKLWTFSYESTVRRHTRMHAPAHPPPPPP